MILNLAACDLGLVIIRILQDTWVGILIRRFTGLSSSTVFPSVSCLSYLSPALLPPCYSSYVLTPTSIDQLHRNCDTRRLYIVVCQLWRVMFQMHCSVVTLNTCCFAKTWYTEMLIFVCYKKWSMFHHDKKRKEKFNILNLRLILRSEMLTSQKLLLLLLLLFHLFIF